MLSDAGSTEVPNREETNTHTYCLPLSRSIMLMHHSNTKLEVLPPKETLRADIRPESLKIDAIEIEFVTLGEDAPAARFDPKEGKILVNKDHPLVTDSLG